MRRIGLVLAVTVLGLATLAQGSAIAATSGGRYDRPEPGFSEASTRLRTGTPERAGLDPTAIKDALAAVRGWTEPSGNTRPMFGGAVTLLGHDGKVVTRESTGWALRYADGAGTELPRDQWQAMRPDTIFDLASVSKLFTSIVVMRQIDAGRVELDAPVARYVPEFAANGKERVTVRQLLTHTSGLPAWLPLWSAYPDVPSRLNAALTAKPRTTPGSTYEYSDLNLIGLGVLVERVTGKRLDRLVADGITGPLKMRDTGYNPAASDKSRIAATEYQASPPRGMVQGSVHDENAWSLGGVAGHAGVFSTADDLAVLAQSMLNGGTYDGERILSRRAVEQMITNFNGAFPGDDHGLGFELDQRWYMAGLASPRSAGHTGYTGTSLVIDFPSRSFAILLTNRVHPSRNWGSNNPSRRAVAQGLALAMAVRPRHGSEAWFSGTADASTATLDVPVTVPASGAGLSFDAFVDSEETDLLYLESSADGGATFTKVPFEVHDRGRVTRTDGSYAASGDRRWVRVRAALAPGAQTLRWRYTTDPLYAGRGVYVDGVRVTAGDTVLLNGEKHPDAFTAKGWRPATR
ncbi:MAG: serine hydrolase [Streptosporangiales bacterium]|nr:serine hydrolase [Streptosporangiales bacterium]